MSSHLMTHYVLVKLDTQSQLCLQWVVQYCGISLGVDSNCLQCTVLHVYSYTLNFVFECFRLYMEQTDEQTEMGNSINVAF